MENNTFEYVVPCHFGMEAVLKREIMALGYEIVNVADGRVTFRGDEKAIARANIFLRTAERVLLCVGRFKARTFDELFEATKAIPWGDYIPVNGKFWVKKASTAKSQLFSSSDIQSIVKKAIVERLKMTYRVDWFKEDGDEYPLRVFILKDEVTLALDTTGESLHKRGYRKLTGKAPVSETLAAALIMLTPWNKDRILVDPFCGSVLVILLATGAVPILDIALGSLGRRHCREVFQIRVVVYIQLSIAFAAELTLCLVLAGGLTAGVLTECLAAEVALMILIGIGALTQNLFANIALVIFVTIRVLDFIRFCSALGTLVLMVGFIR